MEKPKLTPKDFFLYVGAMVTLYWSAGSLIALLFKIVDIAYWDNLNSYFDPYSSGIRFAIASLIVVFPISLFLFRTIKREAQKDPIKLQLPIRRWLYSLTIFVTSVALIGDIIALLNSFLGGELTVRFTLKIISVLVVAGLVFWYCLLEFKLRADSGAKTRKEFLWGAPILVLAAIVYGFIVMGSPSAIRSMRLDERRAQDLQSIQWQIVNYWQQKARLPDTLQDLSDSISGFTAPVDPETSTPYEYEKGAGIEFKLCATFEKASSKGGDARGMYFAPIMRSDENWQHGVGRTCFDRSIDPELYPVKEKPAMPVPVRP